MTRRLYGETQQIMWTTGAGLNGNVKAVLVNVTGAGTLYTPNFATDDFLDDIPAGARIATSGNLANKTFTLGVFDADDFSFTGVSGDQSEAIVIYVDTGNAATSRLILYDDQATGLPITPSGGDIPVTFDNGTNKIAKIGI